MTPKEHAARAMLLGLRYHPGNGEPFYYQLDTNGKVDLATMVDAITLEPMVPPKTYDDIYIPSERVFLAVKTATADILREKYRRLYAMTPKMEDFIEKTASDRANGRFLK